ncbi:calcium-translocating P-type ATPase [Dendrothele bispora CBS 962.96]|uniref:Calcium-translocating P-type ATPase n=1 Tax=Dendrothele bispora (strain CBS 962.96) TaxID=1314807 RepID=A0A4S8LY19_DENBC|nr:calcium-translocating P-type ATPase [Dendrothele bispora CBS 962.96]
MALSLGLPVGHDRTFSQVEVRLAFLSPGDPGHSKNSSHGRKGSIAASLASTTEAGSDPDSLTRRPSHDVELFKVKTDTTDATQVSKNSCDQKGPKGRGSPSEGSDHEDGPKSQRTDLQQDIDGDPAPFKCGFKFKPNELAHIIDPKSYEALKAIGAITRLPHGLGVDPSKGLNDEQGNLNMPLTRVKSAEAKGGITAPGDKSLRQNPSHNPGGQHLPALTLTEPDGGVAGVSPSPSSSPSTQSIVDRHHIYGENTFPARASKTLLQLMFAAMKDKVLILLAIAAVISLALGFFQDFGVAITVAISIVVIVGSVNNWQKELQFQALNDKKEEHGVHVVRGGVELVIDVKQVVVGDIAILEPGEIVPCDGVFLSGHNVRCDESGATGESDAIRKVTWSEWTALRVKEKIGHSDTVDPHSELAHTDCFIISGSKVLEGVGRYVVVAVGQKSFNGRIMMALRGDAENTPLQLKLNNLAELIAKLGSAAGLILFTALMIRFFVQLGTGDPVSEKGIAFVNILTISVTVIVVAVPEGLPLAVTLALAFATNRMTSENLLVRVLGSCETVANASVVCTDKTGTLMQNIMSVVAGSIGIHAKFVRNITEHEGRTNANEPGEGHSGPAPKPSRKHDKDFSLDQSELNSALSSQLQALFNESIAVNTKAFEDKDPMTREVVFVGKFAKELGRRNYRETQEELGTLGVVIKTSGGRYRLHAVGASETLSKKCTRHVVSQKDDEVETREIDELAADNISRTIIFANQMLQTISLCYQDMEQWPPSGARINEAREEDLARDMTLIGITGIENPLRPGVTEAVAKCHRAGVSVKTVTGDNVLTARSIASQCGIFAKGGIITEGPVFRQLSQPDMIEIVPHLQVLARSSPEDKKILVETLKHIGEIVGTNDGPAVLPSRLPALKTASDVIATADNFASIVKAIIWGRCVNDSVRKFFQFQLSTNVTAVVITFVSPVVSVEDEEESVLLVSTVQLLWINIIMDTFAALALATDPASEALLDRKPKKKMALFNMDMYKQILLQSLYQIVITFLFYSFVFYSFGRQIICLEDTEHNSDVIQTTVFNTFVFAQILNSLNIFEGITRNYYFKGIILNEIAVQILIVFLGGSTFQVARVLCCETRANASVVCTNKTGTLTQDIMSVVAGSIGIYAKFVRNITEHEGRTNANELGGGVPAQLQNPLANTLKTFL